MNKNGNIKILIISLIIGIMMLSGCIGPKETTTQQVIRPNILTYSDVLKTYPTGSEMCDTNINLDGKDEYDNWKLSSGVIRIGNISGSRIVIPENITFTWEYSKDSLKCYGAKITINSSDRFEIDGVAHKPGAKLTVNKDLQWVEVSSWDKDSPVISPLDTVAPIPLKTAIPVVTMTPVPLKTVIPTETETPVPVKSPQDYRRLSTGTFLVRTSTGMGELTIENGIDFDAIIVLSRSDMPKEAVISVYIRSKDSYTISNIPDGTYILYYSLGNDWDNQLKEFSISEGSSRFEAELKFETTNSFSTTYSATLYGVVEGNARTRHVDKSEFPIIG